MIRNENILFLFEGEIIEKQYFKKMEEALLKNWSSKVHCVYYKTNIYNLYEALASDSDLDIILFLKERARKNDSSKLELFDSDKFSQIYLVFDLDPHDNLYKDNKILEIIEFFNDETENGKLYINYPMFESIKHIECLPDLEYKTRVFEIAECGSYKRHVGQKSIIPHIKNYDSNIIKEIIKHNLDKYSYLVGKKMNYENYNKYFNQTKLFSIEKEFLNKREVSIFNSFCFWTIDYLGKKTFNWIIK